MKNQSPLKGASDLRKRAEDALVTQTARLEKLSKQDIKRLVHELGTHQIELEIQNEDLSRALGELEDVSRRYKDLYDFAPIGYLTLDPQNMISEVNQAAAEMLGCGKRALLGKPFTLFLAEKADCDIFYRHRSETLLKQTRRTCELNLKTKEGRVFHAQLQSVAAEGIDDKTGAIRTAVSDISELKRALQGLGHELVARNKLEESLKQTNTELETANKELTAFIYSVSHDLRAPLRIISGFIQLLTEDYAERLDPKGKDYLTRIYEGAKRMNTLIEDLLDLSRISRQAVNRMEFIISNKVSNIVDNLRATSPDRKVEVAIQEGLKAYADSDLTDIVLNNILGNAWKFTSKNPNARIEFGSLKQEGKTVYYVRDNGAGFNPAYKGKLFQPFHRLHTNEEFEGIGIGLTNVERIIRSHGGKIWAEGEVDKGATFYFTLQ